jgi:hypothetical protein
LNKRIRERTASSNPFEHTANVKKEFRKFSEHLREDVIKVDEPQAKTLFEVSAEVIERLEKRSMIMKKK